MSDSSSPPARSNRRTFVTALLGIGVAGAVGMYVGIGKGNRNEVPSTWTPEAGTTTPEPGTESGDPTAWEPAAGLPSDARVTETEVITGLEVPWDLTFAGKDAFFTERPTGVRRIATDVLLSGEGLTTADTDLVVTKGDLPGFEEISFSGFLGVAAHPNYPKTPDIYIYHSYSDAQDNPLNRVVRFDLRRRESTVIVDGIPGTGVHHGGRITFDDAGDLWITTGDANQPELAQDPASLAGAVLRVTPDGEPAEGNPGIEGGDPRTFSYGHRNPQGIAFTPDGSVLVNEHGPQSRDELQVLTPGGNYGWPIARGGPDDPEYESYDENEAFTPPILNIGLEPSWAPSGSTFYTGGTIEAWQNRLLLSGLVSQTLWAVTLVRPESDVETPLGPDGIRFDAPWLDDSYTATAHPLYTEEYGRLRHIEQGPNGSLFLLTSNRDGRIRGKFPVRKDDRIIRIDPA